MKKHSFLKEHLFQILTAFFWLLILLVYFYFKISHNLSNKDIAINIYFSLKKDIIFGGILYILVYLLRTIIFIPASFLVVLSPSLFGFIPAFLYTMIGENLSAVFGYFLGKFLGKSIMSWTIVSKLEPMKVKLKKNPFNSIFISRLLFLPFDAVNYLSGFLHINFKSYFWATFLGTIPGILILLFAGNGIKNIDKFNLAHVKIDFKYLVLSGVLILFSIIVSFILNKRK
ncbi:VTT domain-containing protein [Candidatus Gracilibacteria bacterium]|nr:VTT domain-containing protein [Candidatus Gracilibacteria bacterium]